MSIALDEVDDCNTCPFSHYTGILWWCTHTAHPVAEPRKLKLSTDEIESGKTPDWCPLKENPVFIRWRGKSP